MVYIWFYYLLPYALAVNIPVSSHEHVIHDNHTRTNPPHMFGMCMDGSVTGISPKRDEVVLVGHSRPYANIQQPSKQDVLQNIQEDTHEDIQQDSRLPIYLETYLRFLQTVLEVLEDGQCKNDVKEMVDGLRALRLWALRMADATAKLPSGFLHGNLRLPGDFNECMSVKVGNGGNAQYCLASVYVGSDDHIWQGILNGSMADRQGRELPAGVQVAVFLPIFSRIEWAVCVPASCTSTNVEDSLNAVFAHSFAHTKISVRAQVPPLSCQQQQVRPLGSGAFVMLSILTGAAILVFLGSLFEIRQVTGDKPGIVKKILLAFSLPGNWRRLTCTTRLRAGTIGCLNGIRCLSIFWVLAHHKLLLFSMTPIINKLQFLQEARNPANMLFLNCAPAVDTFFLMSGILRAVSFLKEHEVGVQRWASVCVRYLRLTPAYALMIGVHATLLVHLSSGPYWEEMVGSQATWCAQHWPLNIAYVNNYINTRTMCMLQSWYLAADMHMYILSTFALLVMRPFPRWRTHVLITLLLISVIVPMVITGAYHLPGIYGASYTDEQMIDYMRYSYAVTHNRLSPYLVGIALGFRLYRVEQSSVTLSKLTVLLAWTLSLTVLTAVVFGPYHLMQADYTYSAVQAALYAGLHRLAWAMAVAWVVFACHQGYGGPVNALLTWSPLQVLGQLTYCVYLTHLAVFMVSAASTHAVVHYKFYSLVQQLITDSVITLLPSLLLHLCFELPCLTISRDILRYWSMVQ